MALVSSRKYALDNGLPERTVRGWAERGEVAGAQLIGKAWVADSAAWAAVAEKERGRGRPRKTEPQEPR